MSERRAEQLFEIISWIKNLALFPAGFLIGAITVDFITPSEDAGLEIRRILYFVLLLASGALGTAWALRAILDRWVFEATKAQDALTQVHTFRFILQVILLATAFCDMLIACFKQSLIWWSAGFVLYAVTRLWIILEFRGPTRSIVESLKRSDSPRGSDLAMIL